MGSLRTYNKKRDFAKTAEPRGDEVKSSSDALRFVIQKHDATRLHYDFRLEIGGVLKSWAVPKGPSLDPADKRLAVETEDHPMAYGAFEGNIPHGEYGGGPVLLWDHGSYVPEGDAQAAYDKGRITFTLHGEKLQGRFHLVRLRGDDKKPQWLLMKSKDEHAKAGVGVGEIPEASVKSGLSLREIASKSTAVWRSNRERAVPAFVAPALCTAVDDAPEGSAWVHEPKIDGYRIVARKDGDDVSLFSRSGLDWSDKFPDVVRAVRGLSVPSAIVDGEVAVLGESGASEFQKLQRAVSDADLNARVVYFVFDCVFNDGHDLRSLPLTERKELLAALVDGAPAVIQYVPHVVGGGADFLERMRGEGLEGMVSKRADAPYRSERTRDWLKLRITSHEEFVVVGYTPLQNHSDAVGALLVAARGDDGALSYRGKVGTGYRDKDRRELFAMLSALAVHASPVGKRVRDATWVKPQVMVEVEFKEVTDDGNLRHPSFMGVRRDKTDEGAAQNHDVFARSHAPSLASTDPVPAVARAGVGDPDHDVVAGVRITHPERTLFDVSGRSVSKLEIARYIEAVAPLMLPHVRGRPLAVVRCPSGSTGPSFFQKHAMRGMPPGIDSIMVDEGKGRAETLTVHDVSGLVGLVQMGVLEFHCWGAAEDDAEKPDRIVIDLDPDESLPWARIADAARDVRERLARDGLRSWVKTTGGKALHVVAPLTPSASWDEVKAYAYALAKQMESDAPERYTANLKKSTRVGRIFIDYLRNGRGATAIAPYSMRKKPGAPVAVPLAWKEIDDVRGDQWSVLTLHERIAVTPDPWRPYFTTKQRVPQATRRGSSTHAQP